jgi:hypothetical protein
MGLLTPLRRLYPFASSSGQHFACDFLQFSPHDDTLAIHLTLPLAGCVEDFHLQVIFLSPQGIR